MKLSIIATTILFTMTLAACNQKKPETNNNVENTSSSSAFEKEHTAENSLDWNGTYQGTLPCADCSGIKTVLTLNLDKTYTLEETYIDRDAKPIISKGTFQFNTENTSIISLDNAAQQRQFFIGEGFATVRALDGSEIDGELKEHYRLAKQD